MGRISWAWLCAVVDNERCVVVPLGGKLRSCLERWFRMPIASIRFKSKLRVEDSRKYQKLTMALFACFSSLGIPPSLGRANDIIYWSKSEFTIPYHVDRNGKLPTEVKLESSVDLGATWSVHAHGDLQSRQFRIETKEDGLIWFRIKTIDESGRPFDPGGAPLKIMVDTKSPDLSLTIDTNERGDMEARFVVRDANPVATGIRLEYQTEQDQRWVTIPFTTSEGLTELSGNGTWALPTAARQLVVRLIVRDAAGNESEVTRLPQVPKTAFGRGGLQLASGSPTPRFTQNYPSVNPGPPNVAMPPSRVAVPKPPSLLGKDQVSNTSNSSPIGDSSQSASQTSLPLTTNAPLATSIGSGSPYPLRSLDEINSQAPKSNDEVLYLDGTPAIPNTNSDQAPNNSFGARKLDEAERTQPSVTEKPFYSSSKAFSLDYTVDSPAASPISAVELWGTADGGKTWERWGTDPDGVSPFDIKVETEGLFGFRMVIIGSNGLASNRPRNGDNADAWIHVDTEIPTARIHSAQYGQGTEAGTMVIEYAARDGFFGERPISLSYSELPSGPWVTIANGLRNTGRYAWPSDPNLPARVYLKIEAHDEAGNIGEHSMDIPVDIAGLAPRGRIQGFRPINN
jgi:hypothetical protein